MLGALIGAGASIAGGLLSNKSQKEANRAAEAQNERNIALQKEFAQSGIQWKVKDAEAAGVHPLYALGAQTTSFAPSSVGGGASDFSFLGQAGQNIGRAIDATRSTPASALALQLGKVQIEGAQLDNDLKRAQLASAIATNMPGHPGLPGLFTQHQIPGQGDSGSSDPTLTPAQHMLRQPDYTTNLKAAGKDYMPAPGWSNAQAYEDRYGELSDYVMGPAILASDYMHNVYYPNRSRLIDRMVREGKIRKDNRKWRY